MEGRIEISLYISCLIKESYQATEFQETKHGTVTVSGSIRLEPTKK